MTIKRPTGHAYCLWQTAARFNRDFSALMESDEMTDVCAKGETYTRETVTAKVGLSRQQVSTVLQTDVV